MSDQTPTTPPAVEQSQVVDPVIARETQAFEKHVSANNIQVPENFESVGAWFNALKSAQGAYTQARQEISQLKKQVPEPVAQEQPPEATPAIPEELRIPNKPIEPPPETKTEASQLTQEEWTRYSTEFAVSNSLSETTLTEIKKKTNLPDFVINDFLQGQKARLQQAYGEAASKIGGKDVLAKVFDWASKNLSVTEQANINASLASPSWEVSLLGLKAKYEMATPKRTANEPTQSSNKVVGQSQAVINNGPYTNKAEFSSERNDPRFSRDDKFRLAVELRMSKTNFNTL